MQRGELGSQQIDSRADFGPHLRSCWAWSHLGHLGGVLGTGLCCSEEEPLGFWMPVSRGTDGILVRKAAALKKVKTSGSAGQITHCQFLCLGVEPAPGHWLVAWPYAQVEG